MQEGRAQLNISLDGDWTLVLDAEDQGVARHWFQEPDLSELASEGERMQVRVPSVWDLWAPDYDGVGWYFRRFEAGAEVRGQYAELVFEAVDYYAEVWLNGLRLGEHEGGYTPFALDATAALREGDNLLAVRVIDPDGPKGYGDFRPGEFPSSKQGMYWSFAGIWGSVSLIVKP
jgi:beta-galactosidase/beta-glucuronidase